MTLVTKQLTQLDTLLTADSVEWCPLSTSMQLLAVGTYQLDEVSQKRHGSLSLYKYSPGTSHLTSSFRDSTDKLHSGILDMKWHEDTYTRHLALANSDGSVSLLNIQLTSDLDLSGSSMSVLEAVRVAGGNGGQQGLCLSLDWSKTTHNHLIAVSDSLGQVSVVELSESSPRLLNQWKAHMYESWIVAMDNNPAVIYSGGDDCRLCTWDARTDASKPSAVCKSHSMGVCSLQVHPVINHVLASGSYDEHLFIWDTRAMNKPVKDVQLGGGIWRTKWNKSHPDLLATACMHNGFQLVCCHLQTHQSPAVLCQYSEHSSLAYGVDWCPYVPPSEVVSTDSASPSSIYHATLASCSFYDHAMHIWTVDIDD